MNSIEDLNNRASGNITYNVESLYSIAFSPDIGNVVDQTANGVEETAMVMTPGADLTTFSNPVRDLLITVEIPRAGSMLGGTASIEEHGTVANIDSLGSDNFIYCDGSGYINLLRPIDLSGDFTIEMWVYALETDLSIHRLFDNRDFGNTSSTDRLMLKIIGTGTDGYNYLAVSSDGSDVITSSINVMNDRDWTHVAVCRTGNAVTLWRNGEKQGNTWTNTDDLSSFSAIIGMNASDLTTGPFIGGLDNVVISNIGRYQSGNTYTITKSDGAYVPDGNAMIVVDGDSDTLLGTIPARLVNYSSNVNLGVRTVDTGEVSGLAQYQIKGIRDIARYNEAYANVKILPTTDWDEGFLYTTTVDDQKGNSFSFDTRVSLTGASEYNIPASITVAEETETSALTFSITDAAPNKYYTVTIAAGNSDQSQIKWDDNIQNSWTFIGTRDEINTQLSGNIKLVPRDYFSGSTSVLYSQTQDSDNLIHAANVSIPVTVTSDGNITVPAVLSNDQFDEDDTITLDQIPRIEITDNRSGATYTLDIEIDATGHGSLQIVSANNVTTTQVSDTHIRFQGDRANINAAISGGSILFTPGADNTDSSYINVTLVDENTVTLADQEIAQILWSTVGHAEYTVPSSISVTEGTPARIGTGFSITDLALDKTYSITLQAVANGQIQYDGNLSSNVTVTGTRSEINALFQANTFQWVNSPDYSGTADDLRYIQTQVTDSIEQANVLVEVSVTNTAEYTNTATLYYDTGGPEDGVAWGWVVTDRDDTPSQDYSLELTLDNDTVGNLTYGNITGNSITVTGNSSTINNNLGLARFIPATGFYYDTTISVTQTNTTANIIQANNVSHTLQYAGESRPESLRNINSYTDGPISGIQSALIFGDANVALDMPSFQLASSLPGDISLTFYNNSSPGSNVFTYDGNTYANLTIEGSQAVVLAAADTVTYQDPFGNDAVGNTFTVRLNDVSWGSNVTDNTLNTVQFRRAASPGNARSLVSGIYRTGSFIDTDYPPLTGLQIVPLSGESRTDTFEVTLTADSTGSWRSNLPNYYYWGNTVTFTGNVQQVNESLAPGNLYFSNANSSITNCTYYQKNITANRVDVASGSFQLTNSNAPYPPYV